MGEIPDFCTVFPMYFRFVLLMYYKKGALPGVGAQSTTLN